LVEVESGAAGVGMVGGGIEVSGERSGEAVEDAMD